MPCFAHAFRQIARVGKIEKAIDEDTYHLLDWESMPIAFMFGTVN